MKHITALLTTVATATVILASPPAWAHQPDPTNLEQMLRRYQCFVVNSWDRNSPYLWPAFFHGHFVKGYLTLKPGETTLASGLVHWRAGDPPPGGHGPYVAWCHQ